MAHRNMRHNYISHGSTAFTSRNLYCLSVISHYKVNGLLTGIKGVPVTTLWRILYDSISISGSCCLLMIHWPDIFINHPTPDWPNFKPQIIRFWFVFAIKISIMHFILFFINIPTKLVTYYPNPISGRKGHRLFWKCSRALVSFSVPVMGEQRFTWINHWMSISWTRVKQVEINKTNK